MRTLLELGITSQDREQLLRGLHEGKYNLLLGAGASYGCEGGDGVALKDGTTLSQEIARAFSLNLNSEESKKLPLTYEEAESSNPGELTRWLRSRFLGCKPTWQKCIFQIHWERIWTFNIDDVLGNAFELDRSGNALANIETFDWKGKIAPLESTPDTQQVIYLHGRAADLGGPNSGLVFSIPEYTNATRSFQQWHASFQTHYLEDPFIVCGATLAEEVDISEAIRTKNHSRALGFPSFIVSFSLDAGQSDRMRRYNLVPIACPLEEFFSIALHELNEYRKTADAVYSRLAPGTYERFLAQFRRFEARDNSTLAIEGTDFYGGDEPTWKDVLDDKDAAFSTVESAISLLDQNIHRYAAVLCGESVSGKSAALLRIARESLRRGYKPFWFRHEEGLNPEVITSYLSGDEKVILFVDDAGNHVEAIGKALQLAKAKAKTARVFLSLRTSRLRGFRIDVADEFRHEFRLGALSQNDLDNLVQRRRLASRLGSHIGKSNRVLTKELTSNCKSELLESLSYIEFSEPLRQRVRKIVLDALTDPMQREFIAKIVCVHRFGFSLPLRVALISGGIKFTKFKSIFEGTLHAEGIIVRDATGVRLRHKIFSEYSWTDAFTDTERYQAMSSVVQALAPLINPAVIKAKGVEHLILREVLDQDQVSRSINGRALSFYEEHEPALGWSSRYWDQRALLESKIEGNFQKAYSYSQKAISLERHPYAFTSLGTICMTHATRQVEINRFEAMKYFYEGEEALGIALKLAESSGRAYEHPFVKFFASATQMLRKLDPRDSDFSPVLSIFDLWVQRAKDSPAFLSSHSQKRLRDIQALQLKQALRVQKGS